MVRDTVRGPIISGFCNVPSPGSHARCRGGIAANPDREWQPCPDACHLSEERWECSECGGELAIAPLWFGPEPMDADDEDAPFVHVDAKTGRGLSEFCA